MVSSPAQCLNLGRENSVLHLSVIDAYSQHPINIMGLRNLNNLQKVLQSAIFSAGFDHGFAFLICNLELLELFQTFECNVKKAL